MIVQYSKEPDVVDDVTARRNRQINEKADEWTPGGMRQLRQDE